MATTQMPIEGVFNRETGQLVGISDEMKEIPVATFDDQNRLVGPGGVVLDVGAAQALVTASAGVSESQLGSIGATPDQVVRLNDGPNKGALLIWAQAAGATAYSWCWWLWPQAAYEG